MIKISKSWFSFTAGMILAFTGTAKLWSAIGNARILNSYDPILVFQFKHLMIAAGVLELVVAGLCLFGKSKILPPILIAWLATILLAYRIEMWLIGWQRPCPCLGNLTDALHIPPQTADMVMKIILGYLLIGSYATLFWLWRQRKKESMAVQ